MGTWFWGWLPGIFGSGNRHEGYLVLGMDRCKEYLVLGIGSNGYWVLRNGSKGYWVLRIGHKGYWILRIGPKGYSVLRIGPKGYWF